MTETVPLHLHMGKVRLAEEAVGLVGREEAERAHDLAALVAEALVLVERLRPLWDSARSRLNGLLLLPQQTQQAGEELRQLFGSTLAMADRVLARAATDEAAGRAVADLPRLRQLTEEARAWTTRVLDNWPWPDQPFPPTDQERTDRARERLARGEGEDAGDILARVRSSGPFLKEG